MSSFREYWGGEGLKGLGMRRTEVDGPLYFLNYKKGFAHTELLIFLLYILYFDDMRRVQVHSS